MCPMELPACAAPPARALEYEDAMHAAWAAPGPSSSAAISWLISLDVSVWTRGKVQMATDIAH